jgi:dipeptidyl-peptidase-4
MKMMKQITKKFTNMTKVLLLQLALISGITYAHAQASSKSHRPVDVQAETIERFKAIYEGNEYSARSFRANWLPDGSGYLVLENSTVNGRQALVSYSVADGKRTELVSASQLDLQDWPGTAVIESYKFSPDGSRILLDATSKKDGNSISHYWMLDIKSGKTQKVKAGNGGAISPDGGRILYSAQGNLHIYNIQDETTVALTSNAVPGSVTNSRAEWSPDGKKVAYVQTDNSEVRLRSVLVPGDPSYPEVAETRFARVGGTIPSLRVAVTDAAGKETRWISIPVPAEGYYLGQVGWAGNSNELLVEKHSRFRDKREFFIADVNNGAVIKIYEESDPAWVISSFGKNTGLNWIRDFNAFLVVTEKDGWRHAFTCSRDGKNEKLITPGNYDIIDRVAVDNEGGWFYFNASPENGTQKYLYRVRLDGTGSLERITPAGQTGTHDYDISPDGKWAFHTWSSDIKTPVTELVKLPGHESVRVLEDNKQLRERMDKLNLQPKEFFQVTIGDGVTMDGWMIKPKNFNPSKKYPVFIYVYGEPHGQTVIDSWGHAMADFHRVIADLGYLVVSIDNRGTPCPKGAAWRRAVAGSLGPLSTDEQAEGIKALAKIRPFVDLSRVGIWGWSGGGSNTLNALFRKPDVYHLGIAVVAKPQPHLYNAWFQEIYMKTREVNPEGYEKSAPINFAEGLKGNLLIVHGSGETNTHVQIMEGLVDRLIELGKQFDYMCYPNRDHGLREGKGTPVHMRTYMARYLLNHLPAGPR